MKVKKIPLRSCVITKERLPRIVRTPEGCVCVDETGKMNGRGAYIKKDIEVIEKAKKSNILEKRLECNVSETVYDEIKKICEK